MWMKLYRPFKGPVGCMLNSRTLIQHTLRQVHSCSILRSIYVFEKNYINVANVLHSAAENVWQDGPKSICLMTSDLEKFKGNFSINTA